MNEIRFEALNCAELLNIDANFEPGRHVVLGAERDGTDTLLRVATGSLEPRRGRVLVNGVRPFSSASARRGIASLFSREVPLPGRDALGAVALALRARSDERSAISVLDAAGLAPLARRRVTELTTLETRAIALAIALSHPAPTLLALYEPLAAAGTLSEAFILRSLGAFADAGAVVLSSASRLEDAERLGGSPRWLERGKWVDLEPIARAIEGVTLRVHTPEPRRLAARLTEAPDVSGVEWAGGQELLVRGRALEVLAHSVLANARAEAIRITALKPDRPALERLVAARAEQSAARGAS